MRTPEVNYRHLRLYNINSPEYAHVKLLAGWIVYAAMYLLTENAIAPECCSVVHCRLDDWIPFCSWFIIPYVSWYFLVLGTLGWFFLYSVKSFRGLQIYIMVTQIIAVSAYILFPTRQDLRPGILAGESLAGLVSLIYRLDTNTGVCPSLHVAWSLGVLSAWLREKQAGIPWKVMVSLWCLLICMSVVFVKQHSVIDIAAAIPMCLAAEWMAYYRDSRPVLNRKEHPA